MRFLKNPHSIHSQSRRPTIGFFVHNVHDDYGGPLWNGTRDAALHADVNAVAFCASNLKGGNIQANVLYDLVRKENIDGLVYVGGIMSSHVGTQGYREFIERYRPLPMVSVTVSLEGVPSLVGENYQSECQAMEHLITVHGRRRIAFVQGPQNNIEAELRFKGYRDTLNTLGIPFDPALVSDFGSFDFGSGLAAVRLFLDQRKIAFDALVAANDDMAIGAMTLLRQRGIEVPEAVSVIGFDDQSQAQYVTPPLSTIHHSFYDESYKAAQMLLALMRGEKIDEQVTVPSRFLPRQSCGCALPSVSLAAIGPRFSWGLPGISVVKPFRQVILSRLRKHWGDQPERALAESWADTLVTELSKGARHRKTAGVFQRTVSSTLNKLIDQRVDVKVMEDALSAIRRIVLPYVQHNSRKLLRAEDLFHQARVTISEAMQRFQAIKRLEFAEFEAKLRELNGILVTTFNIDELMTTLGQRLPGIGIPSSYVMLYKDPRSPLDGLTPRLICTDGRSVPASREGGLRLHQMIPDEFFQAPTAKSLVVVPLYFQDEALGIGVFEGSQPQGIIYETLRSQVSSSLKGSLLIQHIQEQAQILTHGFETLTHSVRKMSNNIERVSENMGVQAASVVQGASAIEEMGSNIDKITEMSGKLQGISDGLNHVADQGSSTMKTAISLILDARNSTQEILELLGFIRDISDQTNVLAINAAIQAVKGGEQGKGFAVIASKIRTLSDDTGNSTKKIEAVLQSVVEKIRDSALFAEKTGSGLEEILHLSVTNNEVSHQLNFAMEEQKNGAQEILRSTQELVRITESVRTAIAEQRELTVAFRESIDQLGRA